MTLPASPLPLHVDNESLQGIIRSPTVLWHSTQATSDGRCVPSSETVGYTHPRPGPPHTSTWWARCQGFCPWVVWKPRPWLIWNGEVLGVRSWLPSLVAALTTWRRMGSIQGGPHVCTMFLPFLNFSLLNILGCNYKSIHLL